MKLSTWIKSLGGAPAAARLLGVDQYRLRTWLRKEVTPNPLLLLKIAKMSKGAVTIEEIILETTSHGKRGWKS